MTVSWDDRLAAVEDEARVVADDLAVARGKRARLAGSCRVGDRAEWRRQLAVYEASEAQLAGQLADLEAAAVEIGAGS